MEKNNYKKGNIIKNVNIFDNIYLMEIEGDFKGLPGQFYMLRAWSEFPLLPRPLSIHDLYDGKISFLYAVVGKGTDIFSNLKPGNTIEILGPLGNGFPLFNDKKIALVSGGIGLAPMKFLARELKGKIDLYAGFKTASYGINNMKDYVDNIIISTYDGKEGLKGYSTDFVEDKYDIVYACGSNTMIKALNRRNLKAKSYYSLESHMACGIGACYGCVIETKMGMKRVCHDGPVFSDDEVIFDA